MENFYQNRFYYDDNQMQICNHNLFNFIETLQTPFYLYDYQSMINFFNIINDNLNVENKLICYAVKACHNINIISVFGKLGCGADCVSGGEIFRAIKAKIDPNKIVFSGCAKLERDIEYAISNKILQINVESFSEIDKINLIATKLNIKQKISIRICPKIEVNTHKYISTGNDDSKFGVDIDQITPEIITKINTMSNIKLIGFSLHIGSQLFDLDQYSSALEKIVNLTKVAINLGVNIETLDFGGGFGVKYKESDSIFDFQKYTNIVNNAISGLPKSIKIIFEPGRFLVANSGILVSKILCIKDNGDKKFAILDAGMNDMMRCAMYGAHHDILPLEKSNQTECYDICGTICESSDFFAKNREISKLNEGNYVAIMSCGAYGSSMSSEYNSRGMIDEYMLISDKIIQIRKKRTWEDMINCEIM